MAAQGQQSPADSNKTPRHPRWSRQETLVLIEGKRLAEERGQNGRRSGSVFGSDQVEAKWDYVASHCRRNGVSRGPIQCRKRWSNLLSDFKKIRTWDSRVPQEEDESFWDMRSDSRRERKLPGFFDREVYEVLDGKDFVGSAYQLALVAVSPHENSVNGDGLDDEDGMVDSEEAEEEAEEVLVTSPGKENVQANDKTYTIPSPVPISEMRYKPSYTNQGTGNKNKDFRREEEFQEGAKKRKRSSSDCVKTDVDSILIKALERNNELLSAQLEDQKSSFQLAREQNKEQHERIVEALTKINAALEKIANKL
ncbi:trihelix transcription factor ASR3-like [Salvia hispanica]|uniref:trihelix transcription factor ASR3-like n=1 Tax=Salvia hispanica TaxID=49212 RepID=UPI002009576A|nr:trihelix transcription factor ASR3-like [Salvia hispanica]